MRYIKNIPRVLFFNKGLMAEKVLIFHLRYRQSNDVEPKRC